MRSRTHVAGLILVFVALLAGTIVPVASAEDERPDCGDVPASITSDDVDPAIVEARELRRAVVRACEVSRSDADRADAAAQSQREAVGDLAADVRRLGTEDRPLSVTSTDSSPAMTTVALSSEDRAGLEAMWDTSTRHWWWFVGGVLALLAVGGFVWAARPDR